MCLGLRLHYKKIDSTSAFLKRRRFVLPNFTFVSADFQTAGRGRTGRKWDSNAGENLLFSVLVKDRECKRVFPYLSVASGIAVIKAIEKFGVKNLSLKWPNDVYADGKKICGILLDGSFGGKKDAVIIGIGINVCQNRFKDEFLRKATSVFLETGKNVSVGSVKRAVYKSVKTELKKVLDGNLSFIETAKEKDYLKGKEIFAEINGKKSLVKVVGIRNDCTLTVLCNEREYKLNSGEVTFHV